MGEVDPFLGVTREQDGTINIRFPDPDVAEGDPLIDLPEEYVERDYYDEIDRLVSAIDTDVVIFFGHLAKAGNELQFEGDPSELEDFNERLLNNIELK